MNLQEAFQSVIGGVWVRRASRVILHVGEPGDILQLQTEYQTVRAEVDMGKPPRTLRGLKMWKDAVIPKRRAKGCDSKAEDLWEVTRNTAWVAPAPVSGWYEELKETLKGDKSLVRVVDLSRIPLSLLLSGLGRIDEDRAGSLHDVAIILAGQELNRLGRNEGQRTIFLIPANETLARDLKASIDRCWIEMPILSGCS